MKKTYTQMDIVEEKYIATVFDATNNQELYKTQPHLTQLQATQEVNSFLTSKPVTPIRTTITNTTTYKSNPAPQAANIPRRCCGR